MTAHLDMLAARAREVNVQLGEPALDELADLVLRLHQNAARRASAILTPLMTRSYGEMTRTEREGMRCAVRFVIQALVLLQHIEPPAQ